ncbi:MAG: PAS domain-containing protein [Chloroflexi bacterium]|nr:PAS domain-containing protein [Chloroflexota bacterium]
MIKLSTPFRFVAIIIIGLFVSEVIVMGVIGTMDTMPYLRLSIIDATLMILFATPFLYFFSLRPLLKVIAEREAEITQRRQTESQLRIQTKALETAANGVIVTDRDGNILWANRAFANLTGYSIPEVLGKSPKLLNSGVHGPEFYKSLWETILSGNVWHGEVTNRRKDRTLYIDEQTITPVINSDGEIENFIAIQQDITERKRAEAAGREHDRKTKLLTQTIHTMQLDIARDLHDTVGQNISYLRMKLEYMLDKELFTDSEIAQEIKRMSQVANESFDLMRGTLAVLQSDDSSDLSDLFARYVSRIEERSTFKVDFSSRGEPRPLSPKRMRQLFYVYREILNNIEKHARASKVSIEIVWSEDCLALIVFDDGCGFDMINFVQPGGHYGLRFMRERIEMLDGTLAITSAPDSGTNILINLPIGSQ